MIESIKRQLRAFLISSIFISLIGLISCNGSINQENGNLKNVDSEELRIYLTELENKGENLPQAVKDIVVSDSLSVSDNIQIQNKVREQIESLMNSDRVVHSFEKELKEVQSISISENDFLFSLVIKEPFNSYEHIIRIVKKGSDYSMMRHSYISPSIALNSSIAMDTIPELLDTIPINQFIWVKVIEKIDYADFWNSGSSNDIGLDGSTWTMLGLRNLNGNTKLRIVKRWQPKQTAFKQACFEILNCYNSLSEKGKITVNTTN